MKTAFLFDKVSSLPRFPTTQGPIGRNQEDQRRFFKDNGFVQRIEKGGFTPLKWGTQWQAGYFARLMINWPQKRHAAKSLAGL